MARGGWSWLPRRITHHLRASFSAGREVPLTAAGEQRHQAVRKEGVTENIRMVDMIFHQREIRDSLSPSCPAVSGRSPGAAAQRRGYSKMETALMAMAPGKITGFRRVRFPRLSAQPPDPS